MNNFFKQIKAFSLLEALVAIVFGILFIACPGFTKLTIIYLFASLLLVVGIVQFINYFCYGIEPFGFVKGVCNIALGIIFFTIAEKLSDANIFGAVFGIMFVVKGLFSMEWSFTAKRLGAKYWWLDTIFSILVFALGIVVLCNPATETIIFAILGITLIIEAIMQIVDTLVVSAKLKKARKTLKSIFYDETNNDENI